MKPILLMSVLIAVQTVSGQVRKSKSPKALTAKNNLTIAFMLEKDIRKKDSLFNVYTKKYPETATDKTGMTDNLRAQLAGAYLKNYDLDDYYKYEKQLKDKSALREVLNNVAWDWAVAGEHLDGAEKFSKQSLDLLDESPTSAKQTKMMHQNSYNSFADTYAYVLYKENKPKEALKYMQVVYDRTSNEENSSEHYILILAEDGQYAKALEIAEKSIRLGQNSAVLKEELKKDYIKVKGSDAGYDKYLASLEITSKNKTKKDLAKTMINRPAPAFALKDLDGNVISLADLKGKVVIIDFWATWCGPCKASFPGMQLAVNKYKNDPNVKFLFVDTWENGDNYLDGVKKFIADNKYTFHVIMDEKGDDGRQSKVVSAFGVTGIPTKFVIDKNENIRFSYIGYDGSPEKLFDEVSNMVDLAENPDGVVSSQVNLNK